MLPFAAAMILLAARIWQAAAQSAARTIPEQADHAGQLAGSGKGNLTMADRASSMRVKGWNMEYKVLSGAFNAGASSKGTSTATQRRGGGWPAHQAGLGPLEDGYLVAGPVQGRRRRAPGDRSPDNADSHAPCHRAP